GDPGGPRGGGRAALRLSGAARRQGKEVPQAARRDRSPRAVRPAVRVMPAIDVSAAGTFTIGGDLTVNRLGFGAMRLTGGGIWGEPDDPEKCRLVLRRAVEFGVNLIDSADSYGPEVSERLIGETLHPYPDGLVIATKGGLTRPGPGRWVPDCRAEHLLEAIEGSLRWLNVDRIDIYQLHTVDRKVPYAE